MDDRGPLPEGPYDLAVIGGGINGAGIARDAVLRGLTVCLLEKGDFAGGTSSRTSKMVHGGIRYLEQGRLGLVLEALRERSLLLRLAPHLVESRPFLVPIYRGGPRGRRRIAAGLRLYDALALGRRLGRAHMVSPDEARALVPGLNPEDLEAAGIYHDGVMDDARLCLANVADATRAGRGKLFVRNYTEVVEHGRSAPISLRVRDRVRGMESVIRANRVARAVGPWTDLEGGEPLLVPSKGVHIVLPPRAGLTGVPGADSHGLLLSHSGDGRVFFVVPWLGRTLVGTTETEFRGAPEEARPEAADVEYLARELRRAFPLVRFSPKDLLGAFAGVRPLARGKGLFRDPGRASRRHRIVDDHHTLTVVGGKYTTFRAVAEEVVDRLVPGSAPATRARPFPGGEGGPWETWSAGEEGRAWIDRFGEETVRAAFGRHGTELRDVLSPALKEPALAEPIAPGVLRAEVRHSVLHEWVVYPADFLERRTALRWSPGSGREAYAVVEEEIAAAGATDRSEDLALARERYFRALEEEEALREALGKALVGART